MRHIRVQLEERQILSNIVSKSLKRSKSQSDIFQQSYSFNTKYVFIYLFLFIIEK